MDLVVEATVVVEIKATEEMPRLYSAQLLTYLRSAQKPVGLLINFNVPVLKDGIKRVMNGFLPDPPCLCVSVSKEGPR
jgi:GxxExxY protein